MAGMRKLKDKPLNKQIGVRFYTDTPEAPSIEYLRDLRAFFLEAHIPNVGKLLDKHKKASEFLEVLPE